MSRSRFRWYCPRQFRRNILQSMGADDRSKGDGMAHAEDEGLGDRSNADGRAPCTSGSQSMVARNGTAIFAQRRTFGHGRSVTCARRASRLCHKASTCKPCRQRVVAAGRNLHLQVTVRIRCWLVRHTVGRGNETARIARKSEVGGR